MYILEPFQEEAALRMAVNTALCDKCGLGKTITAVNAMARYAKGPILVICPRPSKRWWESVVNDMYPKVKVFVSGAGGINLPAGSPKYGQVWITHPETLITQTSTRLSHYNWDIIIADEAHRFKNRQAKRTKALWKIKSRLKWALTATPYGRNPADFWAILHWLYPKDWSSYYGYFQTFVDYYQPPHLRYPIIRGAQNLDILAQRIAPYFIQRTKQEVLDLASPKIYNIPIELSKDQWDLYRRVVIDRYIEFGDQELVISNTLVEYTRLQQVVSDPHSLSSSWEGIPAKLEWVNAWLEDNPNESVVIASRFRHVATWFDTRDDFAVIMGGMKEADVTMALQKFAYTKKLFGTIGAISESLNLQAANNMIVVDGTWSPVSMEQLMDRVYRIGTVGDVNIMNLRAVSPKGHPTIDSVMARRVSRSMTEAEALRELWIHIREIADETKA